MSNREFGGFFPQVFTQIPDPVVWKRPSGDLGPRYRIQYTVPGPNNGAATLVQDVYPYAKPAPVTYMAAGLHFWGGNRTHGGWFLADPRLKAVLVHAGLPSSPRTSSGSFPWAWTGGGAVAVVVLLLLALRRRNAVQFRTVKSTA